MRLEIKIADFAKDSLCKNQFLISILASKFEIAVSISLLIFDKLRQELLYSLKFQQIKKILLTKVVRHVSGVTMGSLFTPGAWSCALARRENREAGIS